MNTNLPDDRLLHQIAGELSELELGPVPAVPLAAVARRARRARLTRTALSGGAVFVAASVIGALVIMPTTGPERTLAPAPVAPASEAAIPSPTPTPTPVLPVLHGQDSRFDPAHPNRAQVVRPGQKVRQTWGTIWLEYRKFCFQHDAGDRTVACREYRPDNNGDKTMGSSLTGAVGGHAAQGGLYVGQETPAAVTVEMGTITSKGIVLTLPGRPGWAVWLADGPAIDAMWSVPGSEMADPDNGTVPYKATLTAADGRIMGRYIEPEYAGPMHCQEYACSRRIAPGSVAEMADQPWLTEGPDQP